MLSRCPDPPPVFKGSGHSICRVNVCPSTYVHMYSQDLRTYARQLTFVQQTRPEKTYPLLTANYPEMERITCLLDDIDCDLAIKR